MNNLKRVLSLVMSGAMLVGMLTVGASAANKMFTDSDEITHVEAVNTMATLGVLKGKDTGAYDPKGNVTRAEMAKIICVMVNGGEDPAWGSAMTTNFSDTQNHWAKNYIAWCANQSIIAGQGDGTFNPDGNVTGAQAAKMMLVALGYDADIFKLVGAKWEDNTNALATSKKLYSDIKGLNTSAPMTRDDVAQLAYNTLEAKLMVTSWDSVSSNGEITYKYAEGNETFLEKYFEALTFVGTMKGNYDFKGGISGIKSGEIGVYGKLTSQADGSEKNAAFPAELDISNLGEEVKVIFKDKNGNNTPDKGDDIYGVFNTGKSDVVTAKRGQVDNEYDKNNYMIKVDGVEYTVSKNGVSIWTNYAGSANTISDAGQGLTGDDNGTTSNLTKALYAQSGDEMKLVMDEDGEVSTVYITTSKLAVVTAKNATNMAFNNGIGSLKIAENDIPTDLAKDDVVVVTTLYHASAANEAAYNIVRKAEKVSGEVTGYRGTDKVTMGNTTYDRLATLLTNNMPSGNVANFNDGIGETFDLYLVNGYVAGAVQTSESASNYSLVTSTSGTTSSDKAGDALNGLKIQVLGSDGSKTVLTVSKDSKQKDGTTALADGTQIGVGDVVTYTVNSATGEADVYIKDRAATASKGYNKNTKAFGGTATTADCVLFTSTADGDYKAYNIRNLGDIAAASRNTAVVTNNDGRVVAVYVDLQGTPAGATDTAVYGIVSADNGTRNFDNVAYSQYEVMVNSTVYTVNSKDGSLKVGDVVTFEPTADNLYDDGAVKKLVKTTSVATRELLIGNAHWTNAAIDLWGYVTDYDANDNTITVATTVTGGPVNVAEFTPSNEQVYAIDDEVVISYVDKDGKVGTDGSIGSFDNIQGKSNVVIRVNAEGLVTAIIFETSNAKDILA